MTCIHIIYILLNWYHNCTVNSDPVNYNFIHTGNRTDSDPTIPDDNPVYEPGSVINITELKETGSSPQTTTAPDQQEFEGLESI